MVATFNLVVYGFETVTRAGSFENVVARVYWRYTATDGSNETKVLGSTALPEPGADNFVKFDELSEDQVKAWIYANSDPQSWAMHEALMAEWLLANSKPKMITMRPPWISSDE